MSPATLGTPSPWTGTWVTDRLGVSVRTTASTIGIELDELVGLAIRRNPRRAHLLVSTVLGKHVPTDPRIVYGAGLLLGFLVSDALADVRCVGTSARAAGVADSLRAALAAVDGVAPAAFLDAVGSLRASADVTGPSTVVVGYAETATALGHCVAAALDVPSLHSTRRAVDGVAPAAGFAEEHSHATEHLLLPQDPHFLDDADTLVLVDDEISTGRTVLNTVRALHEAHPRSRYVVAALIDLRSDADRALFADLAVELGTQIDVVALASGTIALPDDVLVRAERVLTEVPVLVPAAAGSEATQTPAADDQASRPVRRAAGWGDGVRDGARHGFSPSDEGPLAAAADRVALDIVPALRGDNVLVLGFEELMYAPLQVGLALTERLRPAGGGVASVRYSTTTRSPVLAVDDPGYAIRTTLTFPAHDAPSDGPGLRHAHNVAAGIEGSRRFTDIVVVIDAPADTAELSMPGGLLDRVAGGCDQVHLVVVPSHIP
ncbi:phosphoribosyltransferase family protein [Sanguibacter antarcticus]|uniref:Phosphoribosyltransferase-like predicted ribonucleoside biosynthesis protein n=1 Tax=Sanguibacter antarcticus TaxID=372484 RepID=A0A2A9EA67_9MICO|nr:phosphoribosyltransferase family protein [Sanguibacter antarcticus]PFG35120.1 phosphoribosyltransferase-like predicted ribonucleoside biosynthesis protein [Sanguibacter antarcticus]